jgi:hypothetical protein
MTWVTTSDERLATLLPPAGVSVSRLRDGRTPGELLTDGEVDAVMLPSPSGRGAPRPDLVRGLHPKGAEVDYFGRHQAFPIMHLVAITEETWSDRDMVTDLCRAFVIARRIASRSGDLRLGIADEDPSDARSIPMDVHGFGLAPNRPTLERFAHYARTQGMVSARLTPEALIHEGLDEVLERLERSKER